MSDRLLPGHLSRRSRYALIIRPEPTALELYFHFSRQRPRENMPVSVQDITLGAPTTHFVSLTQGILYRGAGLQDLIQGIWNYMGLQKPEGF